MPVSYRILKDMNVVLVRGTGFVDVGQSIESFETYRRDPDFHLGQSVIIDLTDVQSYQRDFAQIISFQARQADVYLAAANTVYLIYIAPTEMTQAMAMSALRSWKSVPGVVPLVLLSMKNACEVLSIDPADLEAVGESV